MAMATLTQSQSCHPVFSVTKRRPALPLSCALFLIALRSTSAFQSQAIAARHTIAFCSKNSATDVLCSDEVAAANTTSGMDVAISETATFGESVPFVPLSRPTQKATGDEDSDSESLFSERSDEVEAGEILKKNRTRNIAVAIASFAFAILNYGWQFAHPVTAVEILASMEKSSAPLTTIGNNGKPTVIDFWAPWCENCKVAAPTLQAVEKEYGDQVNFMSINADVGANWPLIQLFGVDSIPHLALLSEEGDVETALIGPISRNVLRADIDALLKNDQDCKGEPDPICRVDLPYTMFDAFGNRQGSRRINFVER